MGAAVGVAAAAAAAAAAAKAEVVAAVAAVVGARRGARYEFIFKRPILNKQPDRLESFFFPIIFPRKKNVKY